MVDARFSLFLGALVGCGPVVDPGETGADSDGPTSTSTANEATTSPPPRPTTGTTRPPGTTTPPPPGTGSGDPSGSTTTGGGFITMEVVCACECDTFAQDCPRGNKCVPWANDGGNAWNATRCVPVDPDPVAPGEACQMEGSPTSGVDDCDATSACFFVDPNTLIGECVTMCTGSHQDPECPGDAVCTTSAEDAMNICLDTCDPLASACDAGKACVPWSSWLFFYCIGVGEGAEYGEPCEDLHSCAPGLTCVASAAVGVCDEMFASCCTNFCDLSAPDPDAQCADADLGQVCVPLYEVPAPPGLENVGFCVIPN